MTKEKQYEYTIELYKKGHGEAIQTFYLDSAIDLVKLKEFFVTNEEVTDIAKFNEDIKNSYIAKFEAELKRNPRMIEDDLGSIKFVDDSIVTIKSVTFLKQNNNEE